MIELKGKVFNEIRVQNPDLFNYIIQQLEMNGECRFSWGGKNYKVVM